MTKNRARDIERKITAIEKNVREAWEKHQNPNLWGGGPTCDPQGKIVALCIKVFDHVAKFFERKEKQWRTSWTITSLYAIPVIPGR